MSDEKKGECSKCERWTWTESEIGKKCLLIQPNGTRCQGTFKPTKENR